MSTVEAKTTGRYSRKAPSRGGKRAGAGGKARSVEQILERTLSAGVVDGGLVEGAARELIAKVGLPPSWRLRLGEKVVERSDGPWVRSFMGLCVQTIGRYNGVPLDTYPEQAAFIDESLEFDDEGRRLFGMAIWGIPRKNGKTTTCSGLAAALASPASGEGKPSVILAAGSKEQAAPLYEQAVDFVRGDELLRKIFVASKMLIDVPSNGGRISRVAGDGKLNHGLNPYGLIADELWAWLTPRQRENWAALTTADGARDDFIAYVITTAGYDLGSILGEILVEAKRSESFEPRPEMGGGGFVVRDLEARLLVHWYAVAPGTPLDDLDEWKRANPAPWRTPDRIRQDLAKRTIDEGTKRRLYGNEWTSAKDVWVKRDVWAGLEDEAAVEEAFSEGAAVAVGVDASLNHDTTVVAVAAPCEDGRVAVRCRVFSVRPDVPAHVYFDGDRIELAEVEKHIREELGGDFRVELVGFDPRYFMRSAELLEEDGFDTVRYEPNSQVTWDAVQSFYNLVMDGRVVHDGDDVLAAHVDACAGVKTDRGWKLSKLRQTAPIDAVPASVFAVDLAAHHLEAEAAYFGLVEMPA